MPVERNEGSWRVDLSRPAVDALRALPRSDQRTIAARIADLERAGPPPASEAGVPVEIPAGPNVLVCIADSTKSRITVVTVRPEPTRASPGALAHLMGRWVRTFLGGGRMGMLQDLRLAARGLRRSPGFTLAAVLTLALGIGATTAVFSVAEGVLLRPLPYADQDRVVTIWSRWAGFPKTWVSLEEYLNYRNEARTLEDLALYFTSEHNFTSEDNPARVGSAVVSANIFDVLGVSPLLGRAFTWDEGRDQLPVVILGHGAWRSRFNGDPGIVGRDVQVNGRAFTVVGVLPDGFRVPVDYGSTEPAAVYFPLQLDVDAPFQMPQNGGSHGYYTVGRLAAGVTAEEARADVVGLARRLESEGIYQESWAFEPLLFRVADDVAGDSRATILTLLAACGFVLLIACGNVANLILSRSEGRLRDVAVRRALGAQGGRILRLLFSEALLLALAAAGLGLLFANLGINALLGIDPTAVPRSASVGLNGTVVSFTLLVSLATAVIFGGIPALRASDASVGDVLHHAGRGAGAGARSNRTQGILVASQMAMAVILLAGSGLMMRTFSELMRIDLGFRTDDVLTLALTIPTASYPELTDVIGFHDELLRRIRELPGVRDAGASRLLPLASQMGDSGFFPVGYERAPGESMAAEWQYATPRYVESMGIPVVRGRAFEDGDRAGTQTVMMINQAAATRFWGERDPIGSRVATFGGDTAVVVGVVGDLRHNGVTSEIKPRYYRAFSQLDGSGNARRVSVVVRAEGDPAALTGPVRSVVRGMDPAMPVADLRPMSQVVSQAVAPSRFALTLLGVFAALAVVLAVVGVYGVLTYAVSRRTQEIGVRMALGAEPGEVVGLVVRQGMGMALLGVALGTVVALGLTGFMSGLLYGVRPQDPLTFVTVPALFAVVALVASWVPAARAARVPPSSALRYE